jgi:hypothetical protein
MTGKRSAQDPVEAALLAKVAAWQAALDTYRAAVASDSPVGDGGAGMPRNSAGSDLPVGVFRGKGIMEAIPIYLAAGNRKQTNKEISQGLQRGGIATNSRNFEATVATALGRLKENGVVLRFADGWDLTSSYPDHFRNRLEKAAKATKPARRGRPPKAEKKRAAVSHDDSEDKTVAILKIVETSDGLTISDVLAGLARKGVITSRDYVRVVTKRLKQRGLIEIRDNKFYSSATPA